jgi:hypothetical protein
MPVHSIPVVACSIVCLCHVVLSQTIYFNTQTIVGQS